MSLNTEINKKPQHFMDFLDYQEPDARNETIESSIKSSSTGVKVLY